MRINQKEKHIANGILILSVIVILSMTVSVLSMPKLTDETILFQPKDANPVYSSSGIVIEDELFSWWIDFIINQDGSIMININLDPWNDNLLFQENIVGIDVLVNDIKLGPFNTTRILSSISSGNVITLKDQIEFDSNKAFSLLVFDVIFDVTGQESNSIRDTYFYVVPNKSKILIGLFLLLLVLIIASYFLNKESIIKLSYRNFFDHVGLKNTLIALLIAIFSEYPSIAKINNSWLNPGIFVTQFDLIIYTHFGHIGKNILLVLGIPYLLESYFANNISDLNASKLHLIEFKTKTNHNLIYILIIILPLNLVGLSYYSILLFYSFARFFELFRTYRNIISEIESVSDVI